MFPQTENGLLLQNKLLVKALHTKSYKQKDNIKEVDRKGSR